MEPWEWPEDAADTFLHALTDKSVSAGDRMIAAQLAGDPMAVNDALAAALLTLVGSVDEAEDLRATAAIGLGPVLEECDDSGFDDSPIAELNFYRIRTTLQELHENPGVPKLVRRRILEAAVRSPQDWQREAIRSAYASGDNEWVLTAVFAMRWVPGFDQQIIAALVNSDEDINAEAVLGAGAWSIEAAGDHVEALVLDPDTPKPLRLAAIEALGEIRPEEAMEILIDLTHSPDEDIAEAAEEALIMAEGAVTLDGEDEEEDGGF
jgi:HEAT repeat protein